MKRLILLVFAVFVCTVYAYDEKTWWYSDGVFQSSTTCTTGSDITVPSAPYKYGYRFVGWEPALSTYDLSTLNVTITGYGNWWDTTVWRANFSYGMIIGDYVCSNTQVSQFNAGYLNTVNGSGLQCYCRVIGFIPSNQTKVLAPKESRWGNPNYVAANATTCPESCSRVCAQKTAGNEGLSIRKQLYGIN